MAHEFVIIEDGETSSVITLEDHELKVVEELGLLDLSCPDSCRALKKIAVCESPIERIMGLALLSGPPSILDICFGVAWAHEENAALKALLHNVEFEITPQQTFMGASGKVYRADFFINAFISEVEGRHGLLSLPVAVECDGHDFHEKTKAQAMRDKKRDRDFIAAGVPVLHFTGHEVWKNPGKCVEEIGDYLVNEMYRKYAEYNQKP